MRAVIPSIPAGYVYWGILMVLRYILILCSLCFLLYSAAWAQKETNIWYFGNGAGIDFNGSTPLALTNSAMFTSEGCASQADSNGQLLFYTNGVMIWNRLHQPMATGLQLMGHESATQSVVIVPKPGSNTLYYVFTNTTPAITTGLRYSIVDMSLNLGLGGVVEANTAVMNSLTEKLVAVRHRNQRDVWIVVHEWNSSAFYSFLLTPNELLSLPVVSTVGSRHDGAANFINAIGEMKISPNGRKLAVAIFDKGFEVFDFSTTTGKVSNPISLFLPDFAGCYGTEFSPDGKKLYGTVRTSSQIYQFDLTKPASQIASTAIAIRETGSESPGGALRLASNGKMYHARDNDNYLGVITSPNQLGKACAYVEKGLSLATKRSRMGLPNFMSNYLSYGFSFTKACPGDSTHFTINDTTDIHSVEWDFGDSKDNFSTSFAPSHVYESPGTYTVTLTKIADGKIVEEAERQVIVLPLPPTGLSAKMPLCGNELILNVESSVYTGYHWSTDEKVPSIRITKPGLYWVEVFNGGCSRVDTVEVFQSTFALTTGGDVTICEGGSIPLFADGAATYTWNPSTGLDAPTSPTPIASPTVTTTYSVTGTGGDGCVQEKYITVTVMPAPVVELGADTTLCAGQHCLLDAGSGAVSYRWSTGEESQVISVSTTDTYHVWVSNGSCERDDSVTVSFIPMNITVSADTLVCKGDSVQLSVAGITSCQWSPPVGMDDPFSATPVVRPTATTTYTVTGITPTGCTNEATVTVEVAPLIHARLALPAITVAAGTDNVRLPITITTAVASQVAIPACTIQIRVDATSFLPTGCTQGKMSVRTAGLETFVTLELPSVVVSQPDQVLTEITGTTLIGYATQTELLFDSVNSDGCLYTDRQAGLLSLQGCAIGSREVTFGSSAGLIISPNPVSNDGTITVGTVEDGTYVLAVYTIHGQKIWQDTFMVHEASSAERQLPTGLFTTGLYQLVLATPSVLRSTLFSVIR